MGVLFVAGVMNLLWIAFIMMLVLLEKLTPYGKWIARTAGSVAAAAGLWMIASG
jgi:predicted metal-binding membrane protein